MQKCDLQNHLSTSFATTSAMYLYKVMWTYGDEQSKRRYCIAESKVDLW